MEGEGEEEWEGDETVVDYDGDYDDFKHAAEHCPVAAIQLVRLVIEEEEEGDKDDGDTS